MIEAERGRLPERVFIQEYGAEFMEGAGQVFRNVREQATGDWQKPKAHVKYFAGLDLAKTQDYTVLAIINSAAEVVFVDRFHRLDWTVQVDRIKTGLKRYGDALVYVDSTGKGEPVFETLRKAGCNARPYTFTQRSKAALVDNLALLLEKRKIVLPRVELWPEGIDELEAFQYDVTDSGAVRTGAPSGTHDDCVVAVALAAWHIRPRSSTFRDEPLYQPGRVYPVGRRRHH